MDDQRFIEDRLRRFQPRAGFEVRPHRHPQPAKSEWGMGAAMNRMADLLTNEAAANPALIFTFGTVKRPASFWIRPAPQEK